MSRNQIILIILLLAHSLLCVWTGHWITSNPMRGGGSINCTYTFPTLTTTIKDKNYDGQ